MCEFICDTVYEVFSGIIILSISFIILSPPPSLSRSFGLVVGILVYLYVPENTSQCTADTQTIPPFLYGSLFALLVIELAAMVSETLVFSISARGTLSSSKRRGKLPIFLLIRVVLFVLEIVTVIVCTVAVYDPGTLERLTCIELQQNSLRFARGVIISLWVLLFIYTVGFLVFLDPCGACTPSLLSEMEIINEYDNLDKDADGLYHASCTAEDIEKGNGGKIPKLHRSKLGQLRLYRKFATLCCCIQAGGNQSQTFALRELSRALYTLFSDVDMVLSDILAGVVLLKRSQRTLRESGECLFTDFRKVIFILIIIIYTSSRA